MKRRLIASVLAALSFAQNSAYADLTDLPNPGDFQGATEQLPTVPSTNTSGEQRPEVQQTQFAGSVAINAMSRKSGGTLYKVELKQALSLVRLDVRVIKNQLKILQTTLVTDGGQKVDVRQLKNTGVIGTDSVTSSENLNQSDRVVSIEILAESFGGEADIMVTAVADREVPKMTVKVDRPVAPPAPVTPQRPRPYNPPAPPPPVYQESKQIRVGDRVIYSDSYFGKVLEIFQAGKARVALDGYSTPQLVEISSLGKSVNCDSGFCVGDSVLYSENTGVVKEIFANGKARVALNGYSSVYVLSTKELAKETQCIGNVCVGDRIQYAGANPGVVKRTFANGKVQVALDSYSSLYLVSHTELAKAANCAGDRRICVGDSILYSENAGTVKQVYSNGTAVVALHGYSSLYTVSVKELSKEVRCDDRGICGGDRVLYSSNVGTVISIYSNGKAKISLDGYSSTYVVSTRELGKGVRCSGSICVGNRVIYGSNTGTVKEVFSNGTAKVALDGYSSVYVISVRELSR
ncbi:beta-sandwich domain-containing protein [Bdellovibrio bacteriovorus]|uniref:beta-sandwich domain-containing protein n=1 Tax=Bdellovibrio TaxID=958 RepID=UPI0035A8BC6B